MKFRDDTMNDGKQEGYKSAEEQLAAESFNTQNESSDEGVDKGERTIVRTIVNGQLTGSRESVRDEKGQVVKIEEKGKEGSLTASTEISYDDQGRKTLEKTTLHYADPLKSKGSRETKYEYGQNGLKRETSVEVVPFAFKTESLKEFDNSGYLAHERRSQYTPTSESFTGHKAPWILKDMYYKNGIDSNGRIQLVEGHGKGDDVEEWERTEFEYDPNGTGDYNKNTSVTTVNRAGVRTTFGELSVVRNGLVVAEGRQWKGYGDEGEESIRKFYSEDGKLIKEERVGTVKKWRKESQKISEITEYSEETD